MLQPLTNSKTAMRRKVTALFVVVLGITFSIFIIGSGEKDASSNAGIEPVGEDKRDFSLQFRSNKPLSFSPSLQKNSPANNLNLTDELAREYGSVVAQKSFGEGGLLGGLDSLADLDSESLRAAEKRFQAKAVAAFEVSHFTKKDIIVSSDNSTENQLSYLGSIGKTTNDNFGDFDKLITEMVNEWLVTQDPASFEKYVEIAVKQMDSLLSLRVPSRWQSIHLENLNLWQEKRIAYTALINAQEDPLRALIALKVAADLANKTLVLQNILEERFYELLEST